jgi:hypothetical protein
VLQTTLLPPTNIHAFAQVKIISHYCVQHEHLSYTVTPAAERCVRYRTPGASAWEHHVPF